MPRVFSRCCEPSPPQALITPTPRLAVVIEDRGSKGSIFSLSEALWDLLSNISIILQILSSRTFGLTGRSPCGNLCSQSHVQC